METQKIRKRVLVLGILLVLILAASIISIIIIKKKSQKSTCYAEVYRDHELIETIDLSQVKEPYQVKIEYGDEDYNVLEVRRGSIGIVDSSCPDHLCEHMGFIDSSLMPITCLPNHLVIRIVNEAEEEDDTGLDGIAY